MAEALKTSPFNNTKAMHQGTRKSQLLFSNQKREDLIPDTNNYKGEHRQQKPFIKIQDSEAKEKLVTQMPFQPRDIQSLTPNTPNISETLSHSFKLPVKHQPRKANYSNNQISKHQWHSKNNDDFNFDYLYSSSKGPQGSSQQLATKKYKTNISDHSYTNDHHFNNQFTYSYNQHKNAKEIQRLLDVSASNISKDQVPNQDLKLDIEPLTHNSEQFQADKAMRVPPLLRQANEKLHKQRTSSQNQTIGASDFLLTPDVSKKQISKGSSKRSSPQNQQNSIFKKVIIPGDTSQSNTNQPEEHGKPMSPSQKSVQEKETPYNEQQISRGVLSIVQKKKKLPISYLRQKAKSKQIEPNGSKDKLRLRVEKEMNGYWVHTKEEANRNQLSDGTQKLTHDGLLCQSESLKKKRADMCSFRRLPTIDERRQIENIQSIPEEGTVAKQRDRITDTPYLQAQKTATYYGSVRDIPSADYISSDTTMGFKRERRICSQKKPKSTQRSSRLRKEEQFKVQQLKDAQNKPTALPNDRQLRKSMIRTKQKQKQNTNDLSFLSTPSEVIYQQNERSLNFRKQNQKKKILQKLSQARAMVIEDSKHHVTNYRLPLSKPVQQQKPQRNFKLVGQNRPRAHVGVKRDQQMGVQTSSLQISERSLMEASCQPSDCYMSPSKPTLGI